MNIHKGDIVQVARAAGYRYVFTAIVEGELASKNGEVTYLLRDQHGGWHEVFGRYLTRK